MDIQEIKEKVSEFLVEEFEIEENLINDDARLKEDLGIDSLEIVDVVVLVESTFGYKIKSEDFVNLKTYGQFCSFIQQKVNA